MVQNNAIKTEFAWLLWSYFTLYRSHQKLYIDETPISTQQLRFYIKWCHSYLDLSRLHRCHINTIGAKELKHYKVVVACNGMMSRLSGAMVTVLATGPKVCGLVTQPRW
jgi:hypothetical protein